MSDASAAPSAAAVPAARPTLLSGLSTDAPASGLRAAASAVAGAAPELPATVSQALTGEPPAQVFTPPAVVRRGRGASAIAWAALAGFGAIFGLVRARRSDALDLALTLKLQQRRHPVVARVMRLASWPGFPPQSRLIPPVAVAGLLALRLRLEAVFLVGAWGTALLATVVKAVMRRPRPVASEKLRVVVAPLGGSSFPSGHVLSYVGLYGFGAYLATVLIRPVAVRRAVVGALLSLVALVGPSRIHQGHHWFTDVTASYLLGTSYVIGLAGLYRRVKARRTGVRA